MATIFTTSDEIYRKLVDESDESCLYGLLAFAVIEEQRIEWAKHFEENNERTPNFDEINGWYEQQPESVLLRAKGTAETTLQQFSEEVVDSVLEEHRKEIEESIVVGEIRSLGRFWPQFGVNLAGGFASALLFAVLLIIVAFLVLNDVSPVQFGEHIKSKIEVIEDVEK